MAEHMDIAEFVEAGYLQEANRRFFHPLGLALEVARQADGPTAGSMRLSGIQDYREDPEGVYFGDNATVDSSAARLAKAHAIDREFATRMAPRIAALGYFVQPRDML